MGDKKYGPLYRSRIFLYCTWRNITQVLTNIINNVGCYKYRKFARLPENLEGKIVLITGANSGIGKESAKAVANKGAHVIMGCRDEKRAKDAVDDIVRELRREELRENFSVVLMNLSDLDSIRSAAEEINRKFTHLDVLINNAGVMATPEWKTSQGHEFQFGTNFLGHFLLTNLLLDKLKADPSGARIVNLSSLLFLLGNMHFENLSLTGIYSPSDAYCRSKLATVLFNRELAKRLQGSNVHTYSCHPGVIQTGLHRHMSSAINSVLDFLSGILLLTPEEGAQTQLYCAFDERAALETGFYYENCSITNLPAHATDDDDAEQLWNTSLQLCGLHDNVNNKHQKY